MSLFSNPNCIHEKNIFLYLAGGDYVFADQFLEFWIIEGIVAVLSQHVVALGCTKKYTLVLALRALAEYFRHHSPF